MQSSRIMKTEVDTMGTRVVQRRLQKDEGVFDKSNGKFYQY